MKNFSYKNLGNLLLIIIIGILSGLLGSVIAKQYILKNYFNNLPLVINSNLLDNIEKENIEINKSGKTTVELDDKVYDITKNSINNMVGIYKKEDSVVSKDKNFNINNYYKIKNYQGQGLIFTSDGWIITSLTIDNAKNYIVIYGNNKIYEIDSIIKDKETGINYIHIKANNLPAKNYADWKEIKNGQIILAVNYKGENLVSYIADKEFLNTNAIYESDIINGTIKISDVISKNFLGSPVYNLSGEIVGIVDNNSLIQPIVKLKSSILSILKYRQIKKPSLGIKYIDLSEIISKNTKEKIHNNGEGALIYKFNGENNSNPAFLSGLLLGDIIISVDNILITQENRLENIIQNYVANDKVIIEILRGEKKSKIEVKLGELK